MRKYSLRGYPIYYKYGQWFYKDTRTKTVGDIRPCGHCGLENTKEGHDGCLGTLPDVMNACCGHGVENAAYIQFDMNNVIRGSEAIKFINKLKLEEIKMSNFKTIDEEIQYLGQMISATRAEDTERLKTIGTRLIQLSVNLTGTVREGSVAQDRINQFDNIVRSICTELDIVYAGVDLDEGEIVDAIKKLK